MNPVHVIQVGPDPCETGGMSSVMQQIMNLGMAEVEFHRYAETKRATDSESLLSKCTRHGRHLLALRREITAHRAAIVHIHTCSGFSFYRSALDLLMARSAGARALLHIHGARFDEFYQAASPIKRWLIGRILASSDAVIALSDSWRDRIQSMAPRAKIVTVENAVELPDDAPTTNPNENCRIVMMARMDVWKGVDDLLDAAVHLKDHPFHLTLAGPEGTAGNAQRLLQKIQSRGLSQRVRYIGAVHGQDKDDLLRSADVFVLPSHHEGMPIALLEAMSHSLAIVATKVGAVSEMIRDNESGILVEPHNPDSLFRALEKVIDNPNLRAALGRSARHTAEQRFSPIVLRRALTQLYAETIDQTPKFNHESAGEVEPA